MRSKLSLKVSLSIRSLYYFPHTCMHAYVRALTWKWRFSLKISAWHCSWCGGSHWPLPSPVVLTPCSSRLLEELVGFLTHTQWWIGRYHGWECGPCGDCQLPILPPFSVCACVCVTWDEFVSPLDASYLPICTSETVRRYPVTQSALPLCKDTGKLRHALCVSATSREKGPQGEKPKTIQSRMRSLILGIYFNARIAMWHVTTNFMASSHILFLLGMLLGWGSGLGSAEPTPLLQAL